MKKQNTSVIQPVNLHTEQILEPTIHIEDVCQLVKCLISKGPFIYYWLLLYRLFFKGKESKPLSVKRIFTLDLTFPFTVKLSNLYLMRGLISGCLDNRILPVL